MTAQTARRARMAPRCRGGVRGLLWLRRRLWQAFSHRRSRPRDRAVWLARIIIRSTCAAVNRISTGSPVSWSIAVITYSLRPPPRTDPPTSPRPDTGAARTIAVRVPDVLQPGDSASVGSSLSDPEQQARPQRQRLGGARSRLGRTGIRRAPRARAAAARRPGVEAHSRNSRAALMASRARPRRGVLLPTPSDPRPPDRRRRSPARRIVAIERLHASVSASSACGSPPSR